MWYSCIVLDSRVVQLYCAGQPCGTAVLCWTAVWYSCIVLDSRVVQLYCAGQPCGTAVLCWTAVWYSCIVLDSRVVQLYCAGQPCGTAVLCWTAVWYSCIVLDSRVVQLYCAGQPCGTAVLCWTAVWYSCIVLDSRVVQLYCAGQPCGTAVLCWTAVWYSCIVLDSRVVQLYNYFLMFCVIVCAYCVCLSFRWCQCRRRGKVFLPDHLWCRNVQVLCRHLTVCMCVYVFARVILYFTQTFHHCIFSCHSIWNPGHPNFYASVPKDTKIWTYLSYSRFACEIDIVMWCFRVVPRTKGVSTTDLVGR